MELKPGLGSKIWYFIIGVPLLSFAFAPFPGLGLGSNIRDILRGHPGWAHGSHPQKFVGLWIRDDLVRHDFRGQAFYLLADGRVAGMAGMTERRWHYDDDRLFIDSVSRCGNCYDGQHTAEHAVTFSGADKMTAINADKSATRGIMGTYNRVEITDTLKSKMNHLAKSNKYDEEWDGARVVLAAIKQFELMSNSQS
jgi:hypothetical protein